MGVSGAACLYKSSEALCAVHEPEGTNRDSCQSLMQGKDMASLKRLFMIHLTGLVQGCGTGECFSGNLGEP